MTDDKLLSLGVSNKSVEAELRQGTCPERKWGRCNWLQNRKAGRGTGPLQASHRARQTTRIKGSLGAMSTVLGLDKTESYGDLAQGLALRANAQSMWVEKPWDTISLVDRHTSALCPCYVTQSGHCWDDLPYPEPWFAHCSSSVSIQV